MKKVIFLDFDGVITTPKSGWNFDRQKNGTGQIYM